MSLVPRPRLPASLKLLHASTGGGTRNPALLDHVLATRIDGIGVPNVEDAAPGGNDEADVMRNRSNHTVAFAPTLQTSPQREVERPLRINLWHTPSLPNQGDAIRLRC